MSAIVYPLENDERTSISNIYQFCNWDVVFNLLAIFQHLPLSISIGTIHDAERGGAKFEDGQGNVPLLRNLGFYMHLQQSILSKKHPALHVIDYESSLDIRRYIQCDK